MKQCRKCGELKPHAQFSKKSDNSDGLHSYCKPCSSAKARQWAVNNPERAAASQEAWRVSHREQFNQRQREWAERNPLRRREIARRSKHRHRASVARKEQRRRDRLASNAGDYTVEEWQALCMRYGNVCLACGSTGRLSVDHIVPICKGGSNDISNIQPLCLPCNRRKHMRVIDYRSI